MALTIPQKYKQKLLPETTEVAIKMIKDSFQKALAALDMQYFLPSGVYKYIIENRLYGVVPAKPGTRK